MVKDGVDILVLGKLTPFLEDNFPPWIFLNFTSSFLLVEITSKINLPSSTNTLSPLLTSLAKSLYESDAFCLLPIISFSVDNINTSPFLKTTPSSIFPTLIFGPCKSARIATLVSNSLFKDRISSTCLSTSSYVAWEKLILNTLTPALINLDSTVLLLHPGPSVATILVFLNFI